MNTYQWANVSLLGILMAVVWIGRALYIDSLLLGVGIAVMGAGVIQGLRSVQKQLDVLKAGSSRTDESKTEGMTS